MGNTLALIFDFDDTLLPDSTTELLREKGIAPEQFWTKDAKKLVSSGYDPTHAYLKLLLDRIGEGQPLGPLTNRDLRDFGVRLADKFYPGLDDLFSDLKETVQQFRDLDIEFYVISGGLEEVVRGSDSINNYFTAVYGCELAGDTENGVLKYIKRAITFTEKTRYLFEINKGISLEDARKNPYLVNRSKSVHQRRITFKNMIYVGDGLTDIPCFSLLKNQGGTAFGVFKPGEEMSAKRAFLEFLKTDRVISMHAPRYGEKDELGSLIRAAVATRCTSIQIEQQEAEEIY